MIPGLDIKWHYLSPNDFAFAQKMIPDKGTLHRYGKTTAYDGGEHHGEINPIFFELFPHIDFNSLTIRIYHPKEQCTYHMDKPAAGEVISIYSVTGEAYMAFRKIGTDKMLFKYLLPANSLTILSGESRWDFEHAIEPVKEYRVSFVFRKC